MTIKKVGLVSRAHLLLELSRLPLRSERARDVWRSIDVEGCLRAPVRLPIQANAGLISHDTCKDVDLPRGNFAHQHIHYFPIEYFREDHADYFKGNDQQRLFLSSGTLAQKRGCSRFSHDGLLLYKAEVLLGFYQTLREVYPHHEPFDIEGVCLIPTVHEWPDSSLAQMLAWISEFWTMSYVSVKDFVTWQNQHQTQRPTWYFGTALHWHTLLKESKIRPLESDALIFETGGTKGQSVTLTREGFYKKLSETLNLTEPQIISEYGMSELACQAYDVGLQYQGQRAFAFPPWVKLFITQGRDRFFTQGFGALTIFDPLRIDYPWPIRTQDLASLRADGKFALQGRVQSAPLKGCSLKAEELEFTLSAVSASRTIQPSLHKPLSQKCLEEKISVEQIGRRWTKLEQFLRELQGNGTALDLLSQELGSSHLARHALEDLLSNLPGTVDKWRQAIINCFGGGNEAKAEVNLQKNYLIIAPNSHSIACFEPVIFAVLSGVGVTVRVPDRQVLENFLFSFLGKISQELPDASVHIVGPEFRLEDGPLPKNLGGIVAYGEDKTLSHLKTLCPLPFIGFGSVISVAFAELDDQNQIKGLVKDAFSLAQRGCLSARLAMIATTRETKLHELKTFQENLARLSQHFSQSLFTIRQRINIDHESLRFQRLGFQIPEAKPYHDALFPIISLDKAFAQVNHLEKVAGSAHPFLSPSPFVLPLIVYRRNERQKVDTVSKFLQTIGALKAVSGPRDLIDEWLPFYQKETKLILSVKEGGRNNTSSWDGYHLGQGFFNF